MARICVALAVLSLPPLAANNTNGFTKAYTIIYPLFPKLYISNKLTIRQTCIMHHIVVHPSIEM